MDVRPINPQERQQIRATWIWHPGWRLAIVFLLAIAFGSFETIILLLTDGLHWEAFPHLFFNVFTVLAVTLIVSSLMARPVHRLHSLTKALLKGDRQEAFNSISRFSVRGDVVGDLALVTAACIGVMNDALRDLEAENERLATTINSLPDPVMLLDAEMNLVDVNDCAREVFQLTNEDLGKSVLNRFFIQRRRNREEVEFLKLVIEQREMLLQDLLVRIPGGDPLHMDCHLLRVPCSSGVNDLLVTWTDLGLRESRENHRRHRDRLQAVGQMANGIVHDMRNYLAGALGMLEMVGRAKSPKDHERYLGTASECINSANEFCQELLRFTRSEDVPPQLINVNDIMYSITRLAPPILSSAIQFSCEGLDEDVDIMARPNEVENCIINLLVNARDALGSHGSVNVGCRMRTMDLEESMTLDVEGVECVEITVEDDGPGVPDHIRDTLFDPFVSSKPSGKGTGLGLAIVMRTMNGLGGTVEMNSVHGRGTVFTLVIPLFHRGALQTTLVDGAGEGI